MKIKHALSSALLLALVSSPAAADPISDFLGAVFSGQRMQQARLHPPPIGLRNVLTRHELITAVCWRIWSGASKAIDARVDEPAAPSTRGSNEPRQKS